MGREKKKSGVVHIGVNHAQAINAKKQILLCEANLLKIVKHMREYSALRRREFILKNRMKKSLIGIKKAINQIENELPTAREAGVRLEEETEKSQGFASNLTKEEKIERLMKRTVAKEKNRKIEEELEDIKAQLNALE